MKLDEKESKNSFREERKAMKRLASKLRRKAAKDIEKDNRKYKR